MAWLQIFFLTVVGNLICLCNAKTHLCLISDDDHRLYEDKDEICCNNALQSRIQDAYCCGNRTIYFQNTQLCCGGNVMTRFIPPTRGGKVVRDCAGNKALCHEQICCGDKQVDKENTLCCQNKHIYLIHVPLKDKRFFTCCGDKLINNRTHFCCNGSQHLKHHQHDCCGDRLYNKTSHQCVDQFSSIARVMKKYIHLCGKTEYDIRNNSCCSGILNNAPERDPKDLSKLNPNHACCDQYAYDPTEKKCCRQNTGFKTHTIPQKENISCCGEYSYNASHQDCHNGKAMEKVVSNLKRCGDSYIDESRQGCCADALTYNLDSQQCCSGSKFNVVPKNEICCNGIGMNSSKLCCEEVEPCDKNNPADNECCYNYATNTWKTFNSENNQFCDEGEVMHFPPGALLCHKSNLYYPDREICCGGGLDGVGNKTLGYDECCGDKPYKSQSQQCCNNEVSNISPAEGSCCLIDYQVHRLNDTKNPCGELCGDTFIDSKNEICCEGKVHVLGDNTECCGSFAINTDTTECCGGKFALTKTKKMKCCGDRDLYDVRFSKCNKKSKKIIPLDKNLKAKTDVQQLCSHMAMKHFDGGIKYACESQYAVRARLVTAQVTGQRGPIVTIKMSLSEVRDIGRGAGFTVFTGPRKLNFTIEVANEAGVLCKSRFLDKFCAVFIFFNAPVKRGQVKISNTSKFFMTKYTTQWEKMITKYLSYQYCHEKFDFHIIKNKLNISSK